MLDVKIILGQNIKKLRKSLGLSQEKFSEKVNMTLKTISLIENAKYFTTAENISKICEVFNILPSDLFSLDFDCIKNVSGTREESLDNLAVIAKSFDDDKLNSLITFARFLADESSQIRKDK